jgi:NAD dependent epimerase/dehydratase family enzyme
LNNLQSKLFRLWQAIFLQVARLAGFIGRFKIEQVTERQRKATIIVRRPKTRRQRLRAYVRRKRRQRKHR